MGPPWGTPTLRRRAPLVVLEPRRPSRSGDVTVWRVVAATDALQASRLSPGPRGRAGAPVVWIRTTLPAVWACHRHCHHLHDGCHGRGCRRALRHCHCHERHDVRRHHGCHCHKRQDGRRRRHGCRRHLGCRHPPRTATGTSVTTAATAMVTAAPSATAIGTHVTTDAAAMAAAAISAAATPPAPPLARHKRQCRHAKGVETG